MKLLYVSSGYSPHDFRFLEAFHLAGFTASHLRLTESCTESRLPPEAVRIVAWKQSARTIAPSDCPLLVDAFRKVTATEQPDAILAGPVPTAAYLVALSGFRRFVAMSWGTDVLVDARNDPSARAAAMFALRQAGGVFGDCKTVADAVRELAPVHADRLVMFPWGIDLQRFSPGQTRCDLRTRLGWQDKRILLCTRSWERGYGMEILLRAVASVVPDFPDVRLLLAGDGSLREEILSIITQLHLKEIVHAPGRIGYDVLPDFFRMADLYVSASLSDGTSVSLLEAMACGLPAIVTEGYGNLEWIISGKNGWLATPGDAPSLAAILHEALAAPVSLIAAISHANVAAVRERADWSKNIPRLLRLMEEVAKR